MSNKARAELVDGILTEIGPPNGWQARTSVHPCQGTRFHSPVPMTTQRFEDKAFDHQDVWLCPTCTSKLEIFLHIHDSDPGALTWDVLREFGNTIRIMGQKIMAHRAQQGAK